MTLWPRRATRALAWAGLLALAALLGCAGMPERLEPGTPRGDIETRLGRPTAVHPLTVGTQLQYSRQPAGQQVYNLTLDAQGRLRQVDQVMELAWFHRIGIDTWTHREVQQQFGPPALVERVALFDGDIWTYRFLENGWSRQAHIHLDPAGVVRRVMFTDEPTRDVLDLNP